MLCESLKRQKPQGDRQMRFRSMLRVGVIALLALFAVATVSPTQAQTAQVRLEFVKAAEMTRNAREKDFLLGRAKACES